MKLFQNTGLFLILSGIAFLFSCKERVTGEYTGVDAQEQFGYYPLEIGKYLTYKVDSILYDPAVGGTAIDTTTTYAREIIIDTLRDNVGNLLYKIERYERTSDTLQWEIKNVWTATRNETQAIRTEDNLRFLKFIFPMDKRSEWDGNMFIDKLREIEFKGERVRPFTNWKYEVDSIDVSGTAGNFAFDSLLVITEADEDNIIERRFSRAKYAKNIGLVWKEQYILDSQYCNQNPAPTDCATKTWEEKGEKGYIMRQVLIDHN